MKNYLGRRSRKLKLTGLLYLIATSSLFLPASFAQQYSSTELDVGVSTQVADWASSNKDKQALQDDARRKLTYGVLQVKQVAAEEKLVKPVDAMAVALELNKALKSEGFVEMKPNTKPEMLITAEYGRGMLHNPYQTEFVDPDGLGIGVKTVTISGATGMAQLMRQKENGYEAKLQKASYEKLFIIVKAWKYPASSKEKPKKLWEVTMNVDDPDNRDFNSAFKEMLAAGAPYFGRAVDKPEVEVHRPLPLGRVDVGPTTIVKSDTAKK